MADFLSEDEKWFFLTNQEPQHFETELTEKELHISEDEWARKRNFFFAQPCQHSNVCKYTLECEQILFLPQNKS